MRSVAGMLEGPAPELVFVDAIGPAFARALGSDMVRPDST